MIIYQQPIKNKFPIGMTTDSSPETPPSSQTQTNSNLALSTHHSSLQLGMASHFLYGMKKIQDRRAGIFRPYDLGFFSLSLPPLSCILFTWLSSPFSKSSSAFS